MTTYPAIPIRYASEEDCETYAVSSCARCEVELGEGDTIIVQPTEIGDGSLLAMRVYCSTACVKNKRTADWNEAIDAVVRVIGVEQAHCDVDSDYQRGRHTAFEDAMRLAKGERLDD